MKILLFGREDLFSKFGGDTLQIMETCRIYKSLGHEAYITSKFNPEICKNFHLFHLFNLMKANKLAPFFEFSKKRKIKTLLTPIYQNLEEYNKKGRFGVSRLFYKNKKNEEISINTSKKFSKVEALGCADLVLPCSNLETLEMNKCLTSNFHHQVLPNFINTSKLISKNDLFKKSNPGLSDFILSVARIEALKNQIALINSLKIQKIPLIFIGEFNRKHQFYTSFFKFLVKKNNNVYHFSKVSRQFIYSAMRVSKVHILPSWFDTIGLVSLEAGYLGANIVSTKNSYIREYFGDEIMYCDPSDPCSILDAVTEAYESKHNKNVHQTIIEKYSHIQAKRNINRILKGL